MILCRPWVIYSIYYCYDVTKSMFSKKHQFSERLCKKLWKNVLLLQNERENVGFTLIFLVGLRAAVCFSLVSLPLTDVCTWPEQIGSGTAFFYLFFLLRSSQWSETSPTVHELKPFYWFVPHSAPILNCCLFCHDLAVPILKMIVIAIRSSCKAGPIKSIGLVILSSVGK